jgi:hypothetical protein
VKSEWLSGRGEFYVHYTWFDHRTTVFRVDQEDTLQTREDDEYGISGCQRTTGKASACTPGNERDLKVVQDAEGLHHLFSIAGDYHSSGLGTVGGEAITPERVQLSSVGLDPPRSHSIRQCFQRLRWDHVQL